MRSIGKESIRVILRSRMVFVVHPAQPAAYLGRPGRA